MIMHLFQVDHWGELCIDQHITTGCNKSKKYTISSISRMDIDFMYLTHAQQNSF